MTSKTTVLAVVVFLGLTALIVAAGGVVLAASHIKLPGEVIAMGSGALGLLGGLLTSSRSTLSKKDIEPTTTPGMVPIRPTVVADLEPEPEPEPAPAPASALTGP